MVREEVYINQSEYVNSKSIYPVRKIFVKFLKYYLRVTDSLCYRFYVR
jgi:hypothetical protein